MRGEHRVSWAARADSPPQRRLSRSSQGSSPPVSRRDATLSHTFFSPTEHRYEESPQPVSPDPPNPYSQPLTQPQPSSSSSQSQQQLQPPPTQYEEGATPRSSTDAPKRQFLSAPPEMHHPHHRLSRLSTGPLPTQQSLDAPMRPVPPPHESFELDPSAPFRHIRERSAPESVSVPRSADEAGRRVDWDSMPETPLDPVAEEEERPGPSRAESSGGGKGGGAPGGGEDPEGKEGPAWGEPFKVQWIRTNRLPFFRTRHLRNPWNHDREVKVSRDGTELEPSVGQALLEEWDRPASPTSRSPSGDRRPGTRTSTAASGPSTSTQEPLMEEEG